MKTKQTTTTEEVWRKLLENPNRLDLSVLEKGAYNFALKFLKKRGKTVEEIGNQVILVYGWRKRKDGKWE